MKIRIFLVLLLLWLTIPTDAQKTKPAPQKQTPEELALQEKMERMVMATEQVMFVDSFVVDKDDFLRTYHLSTEAGSVCHTSDILRKYRFSDSYGYLNDIGNKRFFSMHDTDSTSMLFGSEFENGQWTTPAPLQGVNAERKFHRLNYPFMMGDGQTLYFAAEGEGCVGGYDIFMTTYKRETGRYLHPINIGMPFNSEANDYMFVIDEYNSLGWFVTDRRQPEGKVCVYVFVPNDSRKTYDADSYTPEQLLAFAQIASISNTWSDESRLQDARQRLYNSSRHPTAGGNTMYFVINDDMAYRSMTDFRCADNASRYQQLQQLQSRQQELSLALEKARNYFDKATARERRLLSQEILADEQQQSSLDVQIRELEKTIRNSEIIFLTNKQ